MKEGWTQPTVRELRAAFGLNGKAYHSALLRDLDEMKELGLIEQPTWEIRDGVLMTRIILNDLTYEIPEDAVSVPKALANKTVTQEQKLYRYFTTLQKDKTGSGENPTIANFHRFKSVLNRPGVTLAMAKDIAEAYWNLPNHRRKGNNISGFCMLFGDLQGEVIEEYNIELDRVRRENPKKVTLRERLETELKRSIAANDAIGERLHRERLEKLDG